MITCLLKKGIKTLAKLKKKVPSIPPLSYFTRREDTDVQGGLCQSIVRYARPQKARSASGEWKYIVNTGQHTQTLRLEKCT